GPQNQTDQHSQLGLLERQAMGEFYVHGGAAPVSISLRRARVVDSSGNRQALLWYLRPVSARHVVV
ncbi:MAG: hypothetical protein J6A65_01060, partial [Pseudomonas sp.]|nr:hypothetical protein [Pseudomonas sp.]